MHGRSLEGSLAFVAAATALGTVAMVLVFPTVGGAVALAVVLAVGLRAAGIDFGAADEQPVKVFFCIVSPNDSPAAHLQSLAAISKWVKTKNHVERILELADPEAIWELFREEGT